MIYTKTLQRGILIFEKKGKTTSNRNSPLTTFTIYASAYNWTVLATALWYHMAPSMDLLPATKQLLLFMYQATIPCENSMDRNPNYPDKNIQIQGCGAKKYPSSSSVNLFFMEKKISLDTWFFPAQMKYTWFFPAQIKFFLQKPPDCIIRLLITCRVSLLSKTYCFQNQCCSTGFNCIILL